MTDQRPDDRAEWLVTGARGDVRRRVLVPLAAVVLAIAVVVAGGLAYRHSAGVALDPPDPAGASTTRPLGERPSAPA